MSKSITQDMRYRQSLMQYAAKYGVSRASRKYNKSWSYIYFWKTRWNGSVESLACQSRRPHHHPNQHTEAELNLIRNMRRRNPTLGMIELWQRLRKRGYTRCPESLFRVMRKLGIFPQIKVRTPYKPKPYEQMQYPGQRVQVDMKVVPLKCLANPEERLYQYKQNMNDNWDMFCEKLIDMGVHKIMLAGLKKVGRANENLEKIALTPLEYQSLIDRLKESKVITGINDEYRKLAGDEAESNIRIDIPVPYSGVCPYVYQDENPVPISPRIATNGDVYLCQSFMDQRYCLGNINKDSLPHALFNENFINLVNFMTTGRFYMDDCNKCVLKYQCPRGCIGDCLANGSIHETDGGCFFRKENAIRQLLKQSEAIVAEHMQF